MSWAHWDAAIAGRLACKVEPWRNARESQRCAQGQGRTSCRWQAILCSTFCIMFTLTSGEMRDDLHETLAKPKRGQVARFETELTSLARLLRTVCQTQVTVKLRVEPSSATVVAAAASHYVQQSQQSSHHMIELD
eukprot:3726518-Amphidinium_carterae.1